MKTYLYNKEQNRILIYNKFTIEHLIDGWNILLEEEYNTFLLTDSTIKVADLIRGNK